MKIQFLNLNSKLTKTALVVSLNFISAIAIANTVERPFISNEHFQEMSCRQLKKL